MVAEASLSTTLLVTVEPLGILTLIAVPGYMICPAGFWTTATPIT